MLDAPRALTVLLERRETKLVRAHSLGDRRIHDGEIAWSTLGRAFGFDGATGLDAIARMLDRGKGEELLAGFSQGRLTEAGEILFAALFGAPEAWGPVFRSAFDQLAGPEPQPSFDALRLRVVTTDPTLLGMPWRLTSFLGKRLVEAPRPWTFEVSADSRPSRVVAFPVPARVLVVAPVVSGLKDLETGAHTDQLREALSAVSPSYKDPALFRVVKTEAELRPALQGMRPHVVYYYGHAEVLGNQACLALAGPNGEKVPLLMDDLKRRMEHPLPLAVFVNGCMSGASGWHSAGHQLCPEVPVVLANRTTAWSGYAGPAAVRWLQDLLRGEDDPVALLDRINPSVTTRDFLWATTIVHTGYLSWSATPADDEPRPAPALRLDRQAQRNAALSQVISLVQGHAKRVEVILAYGEPGNHVDQVGDQLFDYLETHGRQAARAKRLKLRFPDLREALVQDLEDALRSAVGVGSHDDLQYALRSYLPRADASRATPVLWIDWGTFGPGPGAQAPLDDLQRAEWLELSSRTLVEACPAECRIVSFLSTEVPAGDRASLESGFDEQRLDLTSDAFGCQRLPPLGGLTLMDIFEYLREPRNTRCPPGEVPRQMAKLLYEAEGGNYERTVKLIQEAEGSTWARLKDRLGKNKKVRS